MRGGMIDFSSWSSILTTVASLLLITLLMVGIRLLFMQTIQKRRERENRQINERLKTLIAAYKVLGGSFTGQLAVSPVHLREIHAAARRTDTMADAAEAGDDAIDPDSTQDDNPALTSSERQRRTRDAVEAALSDVILLGTEEQVALAAQAAQDMVAGRSIETAPLVASLRQFIRAALDLEPIPAHITIPNQGPTRSGSGAGGSGARRGAGGAGGAGGNGGGRGGGGGGGGMAAGGMGGMGVGMGLGGLRKADGTEAE